MNELPESLASISFVEIKNTFSDNRTVWHVKAEHHTRRDLCIKCKGEDLADLIDTALKRMTEIEQHTKSVVMTRDEMLALKTRDGETIKNYFKSLLETLWRKGESFSGKRPFGDSGWHYDLYYPLARAGLIEAEFDENYLKEFDQEKADQLIQELIQSL